MSTSDFEPSVDVRPGSCLRFSTPYKITYFGMSSFALARLGPIGNGIGVELDWTSIAAAAFLSASAETAVAEALDPALELDESGVVPLPLPLFCADGDWIRAHIITAVAVMNKNPWLRTLIVTSLPINELLLESRSLRGSWIIPEVWSECLGRNVI